MNRGFYVLGSGMLTNNRSLSAISNNMANVNTVGYKKSKIISSTFGSLLMYNLENQQQLGTVSVIRTAVDNATIFSQGVLAGTDRTLDFAISGNGFFGVQTEEGLVYTRNGNFNLDDEGYLTLNGVGRVLGENGPIKVGTDQFEVDDDGNIKVGDTKIDKLAVYDFENYDQLIAVGNGAFMSETETPVLSDEAEIKWKTLEVSNVDSAQEITDAMLTQRSLQACAQALKSYDSNLAKAVSEIGRI